MKRFLPRLLLGFAAVAAVIGFSIAYFQDTETSAGNKFVAGKFNLQIDSQCTYNGDPVTDCTWLTPADLTNELFFNFDDIKPGDYGENTLSLHIDNNPAWVCAELYNLKNDDNGCDKPESDIDTTCDLGQGELGQNLFFTIWKDPDCNNIFDSGEVKILDNATADTVLWPIADSTIPGGPLPGGLNVCYGFAWTVPIATSNIIQSDSFQADVRFTAVQARHMDTFKCTDLFSEVCDGVDNDYDKEVDEGDLWTNLGQTCTVGVGQCQAPGVYACDANAPAGPSICIGTPGSPVAETCDGLDNDCDGLIDEDCHTLTVTKSGTGTGTVYSSPSGINCGTTCSKSYLTGTVVNLFASRGTTQTIFDGWSGDCSGTESCSVVMTQARNVSAAFNLNQYLLTVTLAGASAPGMVTSSPAGISCSGDCTQSYDYGSSVTLTANNPPGYKFVYWSGGICIGVSPTCVVSMFNNRSVTANYQNLITTTASQDAYVTSTAANSSTNYGASNILNLRDAPYMSDDNRYSLVKFNMPTLPAGKSVISAVMKLNFGSTSGYHGVQINPISAYWAENIVTFTNKPTLDTSVHKFLWAYPGWNSVDITDWIQQMYAYTRANNGFWLETFTDGSHNFSSREGLNPPYLEITY